MKLINKTIIIISQQNWGDMFVSKHHYALELSKKGNKVFFINSPDQNKELNYGQVKIEETKYPNLYIVKHRFFFSYILRFKARFIFDKLVSIHINRIINKINSHIDIVWSFDISNTIPLKFFPKKALKIFMPVDEPLTKSGIAAAETAGIIISVTNEILEKYYQYDVPKLFINHGVAETYINEIFQENINSPIRVGLSGNFLRPDIDRKTLLEIVKTNPNIIFECWGSIHYKNSNLSSYADKEAAEFVDKLCNLPNTVIHGPINPLILSEKLKEVDCFLICYDIKKDQSKGTNYHKILEYMASGKVIISNNVTTYQNHPDLIIMSQSRENNNGLPVLFKNVIQDIREHNSLAKQQTRISFTKGYLYSRQIEKIEISLQ